MKKLFIVFITLISITFSNACFSADRDSVDFPEADPEALLNARVPGEWEPQQSVLVQWFTVPRVVNVGTDVPTTIEAQTHFIKLLTENQKDSGSFVIHVNFPWGDIDKAQKTARESLKKAGIDVDDEKKKIRFTTIQSESANYPRDFGSEMLVDKSGKLILTNIQFRYYSFLEPFLDSATIAESLSSFKKIQQFRNEQAKLNGCGSFAFFDMTIPRLLSCSFVW